MTIRGAYAGLCTGYKVIVINLLEEQQTIIQTVMPTILLGAREWVKADLTANLACNLPEKVSYSRILQARALLASQMAKYQSRQVLEVLSTAQI